MSVCLLVCFVLVSLVWVGCMAAILFLLFVVVVLCVVVVLASLSALSVLSVVHLMLGGVTHWAICHWPELGQ